MTDRTPAFDAIDQTGPHGREAGARRDATRLQGAYAIFALLVYFGVRFGLNSTNDSEPAADGMATLSQACVLLVGAGFVVRYRRACAVALAQIWPFLLLLALAVASSLWSQAPEASLRRSLTLATLMMFAVYAHAVLGTLRICRLQVAAMWIVAFASFAVAALVPASGFDVGGYAGAVRGVFTQKNSLGDAMVIGVVGLSGVVLQRRRVVPADLACLAFALVTTIVAQATTSLLLCLLVATMTVGILLLIDAGVVAVSVLLAGLTAAVVALWIVYVVPVHVFDVLGKDSTLTGRSDIWAAVRHTIADGPALGHGYSAFWLPETPAAQNIWAAIGWETPSAHSGYLEVQLELGMPGLVLVAVLGLLTVLVAARAALAGCWATAGWTLIVLMVVAIVNVDESSLPRPDMHLLQWMLSYAACSAGIRTMREGSDFDPP